MIPVTNAGLTGKAGAATDEYHSADSRLVLKRKAQGDGSAHAMSDDDCRIDRASVQKGENIKSVVADGCLTGSRAQAMAREIDKDGLNRLEIPQRRREAQVRAAGSVNKNGAWRTLFAAVYSDPHLAAIRLD